MLLIRKSKPSDLELIKQGYSEIFVIDYGSTKVSQISKTIENYAAQDLANQMVNFHVAEDDRFPVGFVSFMVNKEKICTITGLYVVEDHRGKEVSKSLLKAVYNKCLEKDLNSIRVTALSTNIPAVNLYSSEGFVEIGNKVTCRV